jgi:hypothetical protein
MDFFDWFFAIILSLVCLGMASGLYLTIDGHLNDQKEWENCLKGEYIMVGQTTCDAAHAGCSQEYAPKLAFVCREKKAEK